MTGVWLLSTMFFASYAGHLYDWEFEIPGEKTKKTRTNKEVGNGKRIERLIVVIDGPTIVEHPEGYLFIYLLLLFPHGGSVRAPLFLCLKEDKLSPRNCTPPFLSFFNHGLYISLTTCRSGGIYDSFLENVQNLLPLHSYSGRQYDCQSAVLSLAVWSISLGAHLIDTVHKLVESRSRAQNMGSRFQIPGLKL